MGLRNYRTESLIVTILAFLQCFPVINVAYAGDKQRAPLQPDDLSSYPVTRFFIANPKQNDSTAENDTEQISLPTVPAALLQIHRVKSGTKAACGGRTEKSPSLDTNSSKSTPRRTSERSLGLKGEVEFWDWANVSKTVEHLVDHHFANSLEAQKLDRLVTRYRTRSQRFLAASKESLNFTFNFRGCGPSSTAGQLILDDKVKIKDKASAECERQRYIDKIHTQIVSAMMQISMGLGIKDEKRRDEIISTGFKSLETLVGTDQAQKTVSSMKFWLEPIKVKDDVFKKTVWDTIGRNEKLQEIIKAALNQDPVVEEIRKKLHKYAYPGKIKKTATRVIETTLSTVATFSPGVFIPTVAAGALNAYVMSTGGTEEGKVFRELLMDRRILSRLRVFDQEATLALDNYRFAQVTGNTPLLVFCEAVISDMATKPVASKILVGQALLEEAPKIMPEIIETKPKAKKKFFVL